MIPDWVYEYKTMISLGMREKTAINKISQTIGDVFGYEARERWDRYFKIT